MASEVDGFKFGVDRFPSRGPSAPRLLSSMAMPCDEVNAFAVYPQRWEPVDRKLRTPCTMRAVTAAIVQIDKLAAI